MNDKDSSLIAALYNTEASNLLAFARRRLPDPDEAEDLVSEAFRILSERHDLDEIRNPAAFLMTVLHRQIVSHLRKKYRRRHMSIEDAETDIPSAPDIAESYLEKERAALVAESVEDIRSQRQRRAINLYSLNYKASEIAAIETAAGQPATSHQISCVLQGGFANLRSQLRRRGIMPSFLPAPWFIRLRSRISTGAHHLADQFRLLDGAVALQIVVMVSVATIFRPTSPGSATPKPTVLPPASEKSHFQLADLTFAPPQPASLVMSAVDLASRAQSEAPEGVHTFSQAPRLASTPAFSGESAATKDIPVEVQAAPAARAEISPTEQRSHATLQITPHDVNSAEFEAPGGHWREAESLEKQAVDLTKEPENVPKPQCGGLPSICDDEPPSEYEQPG